LVCATIFFEELSNLTSTLSFFLLGSIPLVGFFMLLKTLQETKGKYLEELELELTVK
jgi:hypothetical protein